MAVCLQLPAANCQDRALRKTAALPDFGSRISAAAARTDTLLITIPRPPINIEQVKGQGHRVTKCITSRRDSRAAPSRCGCLVAQRDGPARPSRRATTQPRRTVLLKAIEWSASVMHSIECPPSSYLTLTISESSHQCR